ncbi:hypothetical protein M758_8G193200 [Ceratodon purpureus]|uniref:Uncharacterized protein n=1 Tax=Ceratodon purpureus TaxID=3225 RepID=A0A8T0H5F5_CERPU|nr:hypothetical protein KC19_8G198300 [Ceratodon purpureus]KAG0609550.1 hypothetical protein M758_8G193200 [Ceratodon purpureus]
MLVMLMLCQSFLFLVACTGILGKSHVNTRVAHQVFSFTEVVQYSCKTIQHL